MTFASELLRYDLEGTKRGGLLVVAVYQPAPDVAASRRDDLRLRLAEDDSLPPSNPT